MYVRLLSHLRFIFDLLCASLRLRLKNVRFGVATPSNCGSCDHSQGMLGDRPWVCWEAPCPYLPCRQSNSLRESHEHSSPLSFVLVTLWLTIYHCSYYNRQPLGLLLIDLGGTSVLSCFIEKQSQRLPRLVALPVCCALTCTRTL